MLPVQKRRGEREGWAGGGSGSGGAHNWTQARVCYSAMVSVQ